MKYNRYFKDHLFAHPLLQMGGGCRGMMTTRCRGNNFWGVSTDSLGECGSYLLFEEENEIRITISEEIGGFFSYFSLYFDAITESCKWLCTAAS